MANSILDFPVNLRPAIIELGLTQTSQLREELEAAKKEIERVKGLVTHAWDQATINCEVENGVYESDDEFKYVSLKDFKSTNNI